MDHITIEVVKDGNIEQCRDLCNELMAFQKSKATLAPEAFDTMNFDTRMKKSYENALDSQLVVVKDNGVPVGYVFSTVDYIENGNVTIPEWAPVEDPEKCMGFYPEWVKFPKKIGCLNNLYIRDEYRAMKLGSKLFDMSMDWLENLEEVDLIFVYVSNGNEAALNFYLSRGFTYSHDVFDGFIKAVYKNEEVRDLFFAKSDSMYLK